MLLFASVMALKSFVVAKPYNRQSFAQSRQKGIQNEIEEHRKTLPAMANRKGKPCMTETGFERSASIVYMISATISTVCRIW